MTIQEYLGWAQSIISSMGLTDLIKAFFVVVLAVTVIKRFAGGRE